MGTGWRRALCTSVQRDDEHDKTKKLRPHGAGSFLFFSKGSNPSTPTLRCRTKPLQEPAPVTPPSAPAPMRKPRMPLLQTLSAPSSPRSPSRFALFKASLLPSKSRCGVCSRGVKSSGSSAVFTAECSHSFHFPCIAGHARWSSGVLSCPVCASAWRQAPSLSSLQEQGAPTKLMKLYDDDEPLVGFNPIPEEEEDVISSSDTSNNDDLKASAAVVVVTVAPEAALVSSGRRHGKYAVALKVKASRRGRAPIDLVTVLDVRHGMMGEKLETLKRGMRLVLASLGPADRLSIVAFSGGAAKRLLPLRRMTRQGQRSARQIVDRLVVSAASASSSSSSSSTSSSSSVGDALRKATKVLEDRRERNPVATVMLLSDTTKQQQQQGANKQRHTATTRFTHVEIPIGDAPPLLDKCLVSVVMQDVHLDLHFPAGEITAVYSTGQQQLLAGNEIVSVRLGEMYADEERELLLELRAPLHDSQQQLLSVRCSYRDPWSHDTVRGAHQPLLLPPLHHQRGGGGGGGGGRLHDLFVATRAVAESRRLADLHDLSTAIHLLSSARALLLMQSPPSHDLVATIDTELRGMRTPSTSTPPPPPEPSSSLTPTSAWRAAEQLAKVAIIRKSMNRVSDLHGFDNARF
ncbi:hypothetical protein PR202_gb27324 [Eleusine coracana subsp. coracana]|uniref:Uncharacterized protein n=1 Tax=Eleusine coracana subsp. coracana TaxID=191504 RepID=A0AAV5FUQ0_ELECO|nr:hypothetical protein QOZ80_4BG0360440 [Eleusine coracana subsp. coracana]GJN38295.1 hypothetical protein PR202_gb27324 [Eleusine coracana subsp. coracana]